MAAPVEGSLGLLQAPAALAIPFPGNRAIGIASSLREQHLLSLPKDAHRWSK